MKVVTIVFGILLVIGGMYCIFTPVATYATVSWLIGLAMIVEGVASIASWSDLRKLGLASGWTLAGAIVSIVLGVFLLGSYVLQFAVDVFIAYVIAFWLVFAGIARIAAAISIRSQDQTGSSGWIVQLVLGVLIILLGIMCIFNPLSVMISVGMMLGVSIVFVGVDLVVNGFLM